MLLYLCCGQTDRQTDKQTNKQTNRRTRKSYPWQPTKSAWVIVILTTSDGWFNPSVVADREVTVWRRTSLSHTRTCCLVCVPYTARVYSRCCAAAKLSAIASAPNKQIADLLLYFFSLSLWRLWARWSPPRFISIQRFNSVLFRDIFLRSDDSDFCLSSVCFSSSSSSSSSVFCRPTAFWLITDILLQTSDMKRLCTQCLPF